MAQINQFGSAAPGQGGSTRDCLRYEAMLADALDGTLSAEEQADFDRHRETCDSCSDMLRDAQQGASWLGMLKADPPVPSPQLVSRILAETTVRAAKEADAVRVAQRAAAEAALLLGHTSGSSREVAVPAPGSGKVLPFRSRVPAPLAPLFNTVLQPRFAMTAAMAFFSVALTLNLTGVRLSDLHAKDLRPSNLRRSFYEANAHVVRYYENLRVVYELESRVRDLQHSNDPEPTPAPPNSQQTPDQPKPDGQSDKKTDGTAASPQAHPAGKPHSGLSGGAESRGGDRNPLPLVPRQDSTTARGGSSFMTPDGVIVPVSLSLSLPDRQQRGLV